MGRADAHQPRAAFRVATAIDVVRTAGTAGRFARLDQALLASQCAGELSFIPWAIPAACSTGERTTGMSRREISKISPKDLQRKHHRGRRADHAAATMALRCRGPR